MKSVFLMVHLVVLLLPAATPLMNESSPLFNMPQILHAVKEKFEKSRHVGNLNQWKDFSCRADVVFVLDASTSVGEENFVYVKAAVHGIVRSLMPGDGDKDSGIHVAAVYYDREPTLVWGLERNTRNSIQEKVDKLKYKGEKWGTSTGDALHLVRKNLSHVYDEEEEKTVPRIIVIITDGIQTTGVHKDVNESRALKDDGWQIFALGVGKHTDRAVLDELSSGSNYRADLKDYKDLLYQVGFLINAVACNVPTVVPPTLPPKPECNKNFKADIAFVLDASTSIGAERFEKLIKSVHGILDQVLVGDPSKTSNVKVAMITYARNARLEWDWNVNKTKKEILEKVDVLKYEGLEWGTSTGDALHMVRTELKFPEEMKDADVPKIVVLITDGVQNFGVYKDLDEAGALKDDGWILFVIGIGKNTNKVILDLLATDREHRVDLDDYNSLKEHFMEIATRICHRKFLQ